MRRRLSRTRGRAFGQKGQSTLEYLLVMFVVVGAIVAVIGQMKKNQFFFKRFTEPLVKHITYNYKYADPGAQGWDEGGARKHIQISEPAGQTFRIFQPQE